MGDALKEFIKEVFPDVSPTNQQIHPNIQNKEKENNNINTDNSNKQVDEQQSNPLTSLFTNINSPGNQSGQSGNINNIFSNLMQGVMPSFNNNNNTQQQTNPMASMFSNMMTSFNQNETNNSNQQKTETNINNQSSSNNPPQFDMSSMMNMMLSNTDMCIGDFLNNDEDEETESNLLLEIIKPLKIVEIMQLSAGKWEVFDKYRDHLYNIALKFYNNELSDENKNNITNRLYEDTMTTI